MPVPRLLSLEKIMRAASEEPAEDGDKYTVNTFLKEAFVQPAMEYMGDVAIGQQDIFEALDSFTHYLEDRYGVPRGGAFEELSKLWQRSVDFYEPRGIPSGQGFASELAKAIYSAAGRLTTDLPIISSMGLVTFSAIMGGAEAARTGRAPIEGMAFGAAQGALLGVSLRGISALPAAARIPAGGAIFGIPSAAAGGDMAEVTTETILGMGLSASGAGRREAKALRESVRMVLEIKPELEVRTKLPEINSKIAKINNIADPRGNTGFTRLFQRGVSNIKRLGSEGARLAEDIDKISFRFQRNANNDIEDLKIAVRGLKRGERELAAKVLDNYISPEAVPARVARAAEQMRTIMDREMDAFGVAGGQRVVKGQAVTPTGAGHAFPQVLNREGRAVLQEAAEGFKTPRVMSAAQKMIKSGAARDVDHAIKLMVSYRNSQLRGVNPYFERTRIPLPEDLREWDVNEVLPFTINRNWMTIEGIKRWNWDAEGKSFPKAEALLNRIAIRNPQDAMLTKEFIRRSFGMGDELPGQRTSDFLRSVQFAGKIAISPLTITRNILDRYAKGLTQAPISTNIAATLKFPPLLNVFLKKSKQIKDEMIRSGAVFGHGSIAEGVEIGPAIYRMGGKLFTSSERGNQVYEALVAKMRLEHDLRSFITLNEKSRLSQIFQTVRTLGTDRPEAIRQRIQKAGLDKVSNERLGEMLNQSEKGLPPEAIQEILHRTVRDQAFPVILSTKRLWWDTAPWLRLAAQFKTWPIEQMGFIYKYAIKEALSGNPLALMRFVTGTLIAGEAYNVIRDTVYDKEESLIVNALNNPDMLNSTDIATIMWNDMVDGGLVGMIADLTWGITDWALGPTAGTIQRLTTRTAPEIMRNPRLAVRSLQKFFREELSGVRQAESILRKTGESVRAMGEATSYYNLWRNRTGGYLKSQEEPGDAMKDLLVRVFAGTTNFPVGEYEQYYDLIAQSITVGDVGKASGYMKMLLESAKDTQEYQTILRGFSQSNRLSSPLGRVPEANLNEFLSQYPEDERRRILTYNAKWRSNYNRAVGIARREASIRNR